MLKCTQHNKDKRMQPLHQKAIPLSLRARIINLNENCGLLWQANECGSATKHTPAIQEALNLVLKAKKHKPNSSQRLTLTSLWLLNKTESIKQKP